MLNLASRVSALARRNFSSSAFLDRTKQLLDDFKREEAKTEQVSKSMLAAQNDDKLPRDGIYKHPYCTKEHPLYLTSDDLVRDFMKIVGPEQVSPHYQSFEEFGKWFNYFFIFFGFNIALRSH